MTVAAMRVASDKEGEGGKAMEMMTRLAGEQRGRRQRGQWVAMATRVAGKDAMANGSTMVMFFFRVGG